ncbi:hypothetical protein ACFWPA_04070 [Rhodococcus sp. NPDC058505]|uniref:hypothetical protein n=1 Tax=unclassified Rhodococcus (in: high G+C Gram-positive bacteria) TaxID=192944 RepID=UPI003660536A
MSLRRRLPRPHRLVLACAGLALAAAATALPAAAAPRAAVDLGYHDLLDLVPANADAELPGGLDPRLPTDSRTLDAAVDAARADGLPPARYAALLHQYWLARGAEAAGIDLGAWDPGTGFLANADLVNRVYANYGRYQRERDELNWAGMAGMAGASFTAGFLDIDTGRVVLSVEAVHRIGEAVAAAVGALPVGVAAGLPADVRALATVAPTLTADDLDWYQRRLLVMQKHIYFDMVPMHEAYLNGGFPAIEEMRAAGLFDDNTAAAWDAIRTGTPAGRADAVLRMADREQNTIVADQWDATARGRDGAGRVLAYLTTVAAQPSIPGTRAPGVFAPLTAHATVADGSGVRVQAPLPDFNWADRGPRWRYIADDTAPAYQRLAEQRPEQVDALLGQPFAEFADRQRMVSRAPALVRDLTSGWSVVREP